jgi:peptidoglycan/xylan/chitin deacetylase (PgdA/CDA1 family)
MTDTEAFWPEGARLAVTVSMQFEAGGQPISGAGGPITEPILDGFPDLGQNSFYEYGAREGVPRILDLMDKHRIKMSSFMIGDAVRRHPDVAAEVVNRGHEAGAHGRRWERQYQLDRDAETQWIADSVRAIEEVTGFRPVGYNNYWIRPGVNTLEILQELGFIYHIDDLSADEPFLQSINGQPFATVPYSVHLNDIASFDFPGFSPADYEQQLVDEFEQLYDEGAYRRRMMVIGLHERSPDMPPAFGYSIAYWLGYVSGKTCGGHARTKSRSGQCNMPTPRCGSTVNRRQSAGCPAEAGATNDPTHR